MKSSANKTAIIGTTFYSNSEEGLIKSTLTEETITKLISEGYTPIIVDGGSPKQFLKRFNSLGAKVHFQIKEGFGAGTREAIKIAYDKNFPIIGCMELEKVSYVPEIKKTIQPLLNGKSDLVVPSRKGLDSYPLSQKYAEKYGNAFWEELTKIPLDMWFGPRTWKREVSEYFLRYCDEYGGWWDSIFIPIIDMIKDGKKVTSVEVNYQHPKNQTKFEEENLFYSKKRLDQLNNLVPALKVHWEK